MADRTIEVKTAEGIVIPIQFHKTAYACWHVVFPSHVDVGMIWAHAQLNNPGNDYVYHGLNGGAVLASTSLARCMEAIADYIGRTEF